MPEDSSCFLAIILSAITFATVALAGTLLITYWGSYPTTGFIKDLTMVAIMAIAALAALAPPTVQLWLLSNRIPNKTQSSKEFSLK